MCADVRVGAQVLKLQAANGFGQEDSTMIIEGMASNGAEPTYCMGDDIPLPVLSGRPHQLGDYFKQRFAQVGPFIPWALIQMVIFRGSATGQCILAVRIALAGCSDQALCWRAGDQPPH